LVGEKVKVATVAVMDVVVDAKGARTKVPALTVPAATAVKLGADIVMLVPLAAVTVNVPPLNAVPYDDWPVVVTVPENVTCKPAT
jgi:hypothetical protein